MLYWNYEARDEDRLRAGRTETSVVLKLESDINGKKYDDSRTETSVVLKLIYLTNKLNHE